MLGSLRSGAPVLVSLVTAAVLAAVPSAQQPTPRKVKHVDPVYPAQARQVGVEGVVVVEITVGTTGRVTDARVLRSIPLLDEAALEAVKQWVYDGTGLSAPARMTVTVPFNVSAPAAQPAAPARPASAALRRIEMSHPPRGARVTPPSPAGKAPHRARRGLELHPRQVHPPLPRRASRMKAWRPRASSTRLC